jgi:hypothetical protein
MANRLTNKTVAPHKGEEKFIYCFAVKTSRTKLAAMKIDSNTRSVDLDPRAPQFYQSPYPAYHAIRGKFPVF